MSQSVCSDDGGASPLEIEVAGKTEEQYKAKYEQRQLLGEGSYAQVYRCTVRGDAQQEYAVKVISKAKAGTAELHGVIHEAKVMRSLSHSNIVGLHDQYEGPSSIYLILDYIEGSTLFERITKSRLFSEKIASGVVRNVLSALEHIHAESYMHRDLKPENLLMKRRAEDPSSPEYIDSMTSVVIADFGLSGTPPSRTCCGSPSYVAPEILRGIEYGESCDVWSLGVIVYIMLSGEKPFTGLTQKETFKNIVTAPLAFRNENLWGGLSQDAKDFVTRLLEKDPEKRVAAEEALYDPWITGVELTESESRDTHMEPSITALQKFRLREKFATAMTVFKVAGVTGLTGQSKQDKVTTPRMERMKSHVRLPTWTRYIRPSGHSLVVEVASQSQAGVMNKVDLGLLMKLDASKADFRLQQLCTCPSEKVCRHIQYVYHYFFIGCWTAEIMSHVSECERWRVVLLEDCAADASARRCNWSAAASVAVGLFGATRAACMGLGMEKVAIIGLGAAAAASTSLLIQAQAALTLQDARFKKLCELDELISCAREFKRLYELVPEEDMKNVVFGPTRAV